MRTSKIPHTDIEISGFGYGLGAFGGAWDDSPLPPGDSEQAGQIIRAVHELGVNFFDIAAGYAYGKAELSVGLALKEMPSLRDKIIIQSKCGIVLPKSMELLDPPRDDPYYLDSSKEHIIASAEASLRRLGVDYLDILLIHRPDILMEPDEVGAAFDALHSSGKVRYFGLSNFSPAQTEQLRGSLNQPIVTNQLRFGLGHPYLVADGFDFNRVGTKRSDSLYAGTDGALQYFLANNILVQAWSPAQGTFEGGRWDEFPNRRARLVREIAEVAESYSTTSDAIVIAWILRHPANFVPLVSSKNMVRLQSYKAAYDIKFERKDWYRLFYAAYDQSVHAVHQG
jgi:predicted oxidoreductase